MYQHAYQVICIVLTGCIGVFAVAGCSSEAPSNEAAATTTATDAAHAESTQVSETDVVLRYNVTGMHCGGCAATIASTVGEIDGVTSCDASFDDNAAVVHASDPGVSEQVMDAIRELGYTVKSADEEPS